MQKLHRRFSLGIGGLEYLPVSINNEWALILSFVRTDLSHFFKGSFKYCCSSYSFTPFGLQFCYKKTIFQSQLYMYCLVVHVFCFDNVLLTCSLKFCDRYSKNWYLISVAMKTVFFSKILYKTIFCLLWTQMLLSNYYSCHFCIPYLPVSYKIWTYSQYIDNTEEIVLIHIKQQDLMPFCVPPKMSLKIRCCVFFKCKLFWKH